MAGTPGAIRQPDSSSGSMGQGVKYPLALDGGKLALSQGVESVNDAFKSMCQTAPNERVMQPDYGADPSIFDPSDIVLAGFKVNISRCIRDHEPRVQDYQVDAKIARDGEVILALEYSPAEDATPLTLTAPYFTGRTP